ncbi:MAG: APC family permease [Bacteroidota bacterium]|nr:APC family permease [Bacteroidota bacterium]
MEQITNIDKRLEQLGYQPQLRRRLHVWHVVGLALALISPTVTVFLLATALFSQSGTFAIGAIFIISLVVILIMLIIAELGAMYPVTGGVYSLTQRVLPGPFMWVIAFNVLVIGLSFLAITCLGFAPFLKNLISGFAVPDRVIAILVLMLATAISLIKVELGAIINAILIVVECMAIGTLLAAGFFHPHQSLSEVLIHPSRLEGLHLVPVSASLMLATLPGAFYMVAAPEIVLGFSEELVGDAKTLVRAVVVTVLLALSLILIPLTAAVIAAPDLVSFLESPTPVVYSVQQAFGNKTAFIINLCICIALFTAMIATLMYFPRLLFAMGRDGMGWSEFTYLVSSLNRFSVPGAAILIIAFIAFLLLFVSALNWLVAFGGTLLTIQYFIVGLMGLWSRIKFPQELRPYRMPFWPILPIIVILFTTFVLGNQETQYLVSSLLLDTGAVLAWFVKNRFSS